MNTFEKTIIFLKKEYDTEAETAGTWKLVPTTKVVRFAELDQTNRDQHLFHFDLVALFMGPQDQEGEEDAPKARFNAHGMYDITVKFVKKFAQTDDIFTPEDKVELLSDSAALLDLALYLQREAFVPFFLKLRSK